MKYQVEFVIFSFFVVMAHHQQARASDISRIWNPLAERLSDLQLSKKCKICCELIVNCNVIL